MISHIAANCSNLKKYGLVRILSKPAGTCSGRFGNKLSDKWTEVDLFVLFDWFFWFTNQNSLFFYHLINLNWNLVITSQVKVRNYFSKFLKRQRLAEYKFKRNVMCSTGIQKRHFCPSFCQAKHQTAKRKKGSELRLKQPGYPSRQVVQMETQFHGLCWVSLRVKWKSRRVLCTKLLCFPVLFTFFYSVFSSFLPLNQIT